ncbi:hypothetical protein NQ317_009968 [Molorchus minor]|uniref:Dol-P-Glc:Glc(2)Man(9)GlcNAc(2)-PP-Dol alpha-1,2-glucosyltransferase n=1 Tax=Molorchus minor TaxID=1323400 RepID=A0ABQ9K8R5_9CUCU|nr:hypothetical protein NQ317_009968 [Molorchus minor]
MDEEVSIFMNPKFLLGVMAFWYCHITKRIFDSVYLTSNVIVDEEFHLALGKAYCELDFTKWDPKVTTLPGLYLVSSLILAPFNACTTYWLRSVSIVASYINIYMFFMIYNRTSDDQYKNVLAAFCMALLPPMFFFSLLYYTDIVGISLVLTMISFGEEDRHFLASIFGILSVICRQNNIVWVALVAGKHFLGGLHKIAISRNLQEIEDGCFIPARNLRLFLKQLRRRLHIILMNMPPEFILDCASYFSVFIALAVFIYDNGSIVVGDKTAHEAVIHIPQLFYFSIFCMIFAWPYFVCEVKSFIVFAIRHKLVIIASVVLGLVIVHFNTLVHPYLLADNRHYFFYIWNRFYGKYQFVRYVMVPVYIFAWYAIIKMIYNKKGCQIRYFVSALCYSLP